MDSKPLPAHGSAPPLTLPPEQLRAFGYRVVDMLVEHTAGLAAQPVPHAHRGARPALEARLREPIPEDGTDPEAVLGRLRRDVFSHISHVDHPRFFAFIPSPGNPVGALADALASGFNVFAGTWIESSGPAVVELVVVDWLRQLCGMPEGAGGLCLSGGSMANLTALAAARHARLGPDFGEAVIYCSDQTHSSVARGLRVLGFRPDQLARLPADAAYRLDVDALREALREDRAAGRVPFCVVASAGTTNTGAVDPLAALAELCEAEHLWLHVDGAYGAAGVLCDEGRAALAGLGRADSIALDPHKWLFQPYELGCVLVRDRRLLREAFHIRPEYLHDAQGADEEVNFGDYGIQLTRRFRALKLWMTIQIYGMAAFRTAVARGFALARHAEALLRRMAGWEVTTPAQMGIVTFRHAPPGLDAAALDAHNRALLDRLHADGFAMLSTTVLDGRMVLRLCPINPRTTEDDLAATLAKLDAFARAAASA